MIEVTTDSGYIPAEDTKLPGEVQNVRSALYGNPKEKLIKDAWQSALFQFIPVTRAEGTVRDDWTGTRLEGAALSFKARNGNIAGITYDGWPEGATYEVGWLSGPDGSFPTNLWLPTVDWDVSIMLNSYSNGVWENWINGAARNTVTNLGVLRLSPLDANTNGIGDGYEDEYFPGGMGATTNDGDFDGISDGDEYWCGTDPTEGDSVLTVEQGEGSVTGGVTITWQSVPWHTYQVRASTNLLETEWPVAHGPREATNGEYQMEWTDTNQVPGIGTFYRVGVVSP
jgi:hypothetical protein